MKQDTSWRLLQLRRFVVRGIYRKIYLDRHRDIGRSVMLAGCGRSGTTWLAETIADRLSARIGPGPAEADARHTAGTPDGGDGHLGEIGQVLPDPADDRLPTP